MTDMLILCPTRGRPDAAREAHAAFIETRQLDTTEILFVVDDDDPKIEAYRRLDVPIIEQAAPGTMVAALNRAALWAIDHLGPTYLGFIGDDHRFRTEGWDVAFAGILIDRGGGLVYGNDLNRVNGDIPTQVVMSSAIVKALGWMGLPGCRHLYIDNTWTVIGEGLGKIFYVPDVVIEHLHPAFGRAQWDEGHKRVNTPEMYSHDEAAFRAWMRNDAEKDVARAKAALAG